METGHAWISLSSRGSLRDVLSLPCLSFSMCPVQLGGGGVQDVCLLIVENTPHTPGHIMALPKVASLQAPSPAYPASRPLPCRGGEERPGGGWTAALTVRLSDLNREAQLGIRPESCCQVLFVGGCAWHSRTALSSSVPGSPSSVCGRVVFPQDGVAGLPRRWDREILSKRRGGR